MARRKKNDDDQSPDNSPDNNDDETFGLPEVEYEPLKRDESTVQNEATSEPASVEPEQPTSYEREEPQQDYMPAYDDDDESSPWPKILGILAIVVLAGAAYWFFGVYQPRQKALAKQEQDARDEAARKAQAERAAEQSRLEAEQRRADSLANLEVKKEGEIVTLSERTRRYYVVIASAIDGDLIMDHAKNLSTKGVSTKIIPPFGKTKFYRLAIAEGDTYNDTQATADGLKGEYGGAVWVVKY
jgi:hypothetical protein